MKKGFSDCVHCQGEGMIYDESRYSDGHRFNTVGWQRCWRCDNRAKRIAAEAVAEAKEKIYTQRAMRADDI